MTYMPRIEMVTVAAFVEGDGFRLVDSRGRRIQRHLKRELLGMPDESTLQKMTWYRAIEFKLKRIHRSAAKYPLEPWLKRADNMSHSLRLRRKDRPPKGGRKQFDKWKTITWHDACIRMVEQAYNHFRNHLQSPWKIWASQVAKNQQKRVESRYGKSNYSIANT